MSYGGVEYPGWKEAVMTEPSREELTAIVEAREKDCPIIRQYGHQVAAQEYARYALKLLDDNEGLRRAAWYESDVAERAVNAMKKAEGERDSLALTVGKMREALERIRDIKTNVFHFFSPADGPLRLDATPVRDIETFQRGSEEALKVVMEVVDAVLSLPPHASEGEQKLKDAVVQAAKEMRTVIESGRGTVEAGWPQSVAQRLFTALSALEKARISEADRNPPAPTPESAR